MSKSSLENANAFSKMVAAGLAPNALAEGDPFPTRQDCRACHQIHVSYTSADWALETTAPVALFATAGETFDGGKGNLCTNCHQARRIFPGDPDDDGIVVGITTHWGPHHGPQSQMLLGLAGAGGMSSQAGHYFVTDTCVGCHMGEIGSHTFEPEVARCQTCHPGVTNFDINDRQSNTQAQLDEIGAELVRLGVLSSNDPDGHPTVTSAPLNIATALWNWLYIAHEDKSLGVHNPSYTQSLINEAKTQLGL